jgi:hypothetical protein
MGSSTGRSMPAGRLHEELSLSVKETHVRRIWHSAVNISNFEIYFIPYKLAQFGYHIVRTEARKQKTSEVK